MMRCQSMSGNGVDGTIPSKRSARSESRFKHGETRQDITIIFPTAQKSHLFQNRSKHQTSVMRVTATTTGSDPWRLQQLSFKHSRGRNCVCTERDNSTVLLAASRQAQCGYLEVGLPAASGHNTEIHCRLNTGSFHKHPPPGSARNINAKTRSKQTPPSHDHTEVASTSMLCKKKKKKRWPTTGWKHNTCGLEWTVAVVQPRSSPRQPGSRDDQPEIPVCVTSS